jgi:hypothetical protein
MNGATRSAVYLAVLAVGSLAGGCEPAPGVAQPSAQGTSGSSTAASSASSGMASSSSGAGGGGNGCGGAGGGAQTKTFKVTKNYDDGMFVSCHGHPNPAPDEYLLDDGPEQGLSLSGDGHFYDECIALRFVVDLPKSACIRHANLVLVRKGGDNQPSETIRVRIWQNGGVEELNAGHSHTPEVHGGPILAQSIGAWKLSDIVNNPIKSPDITSFVQYQLDLASYSPGSTMAFLLERDTMGMHYVLFWDSSEDFGNKTPELTVAYDLK